MVDNDARYVKFILKHLSYFRLILQCSKKHTNQAISNLCFSVEQEISHPQWNEQSSSTNIQNVFLISNFRLVLNVLGDFPGIWIQTPGESPKRKNTTSKMCSWFQTFAMFWMFWAISLASEFRRWGNHPKERIQHSKCNLVLRYYQIIPHLSEYKM